MSASQLGVLILVVVEDDLVLEVHIASGITVDVLILVVVEDDLVPKSL